MKSITYILIVFLCIFWSCNGKKYSPDWTMDMTSLHTGKDVVTIKGDNLLFTELFDYSNTPDINKLLQSDSVIIKPLKEWDYMEHNINVLIFDSLTYLHSTKNGKQVGVLLNYIPQNDISKEPETDCWNSCNLIKLATLGCTCEFELCSNYKGYRIVLSYFSRHFKDETSPQKLTFLIFEQGEIISEQRVTNYNNIVDSHINYFTSSDAVYFYHYYSDYSGKNKVRILAKFSFDKLIGNIE